MYIYKMCKTTRELFVKLQRRNCVDNYNKARSGKREKEERTRFGHKQHSMGDSLIAIKGKDYVIVAADSGATRSILKLKENEDKIVALDSSKLLAGSGPVGDRVQFSEYIQKNVKLYQFRNNIPLSNHAAANFIRTELADALRSAPYQVNLLLAGFDKKGPALYWIDYLAALQELDFASQGYAGYFVSSILDRHYSKEMDFEEGLKLLRLCFKELQTRFVINTNTWFVKVVDKDGVRTVIEVEENGAEVRRDEKAKEKMED